MIDINELKTMLKAMNLVHVSKGAGVNYGRVWRLVHTDTRPSYDTVQKIVKYIDSITPIKAA
jgi:hypothetical protein